MGVGRLSGEVVPPGDKSISHRALILGALASGTSRIRGLNPGEDVAATRRVLEALGVRVSDVPDAADGGDGTVSVAGTGGRLGRPSGPLDCGNSGTTMRLMTGVLAGMPIEATLVGDASLSSRPMERVAGPLRRMGARVTTTEGHAPLGVSGGGLTGIDFSSPVASAQVKSAVLLAGLGARGTTRVTEPARSRDHTERMLVRMGADLRTDGRTIELRGGASLAPLDLSIPGDPSAAAFYLAAALLVPGSRVRVRGVDVNPTRTGFLAALERMGARIERSGERDEGGEPVCDLEAIAGPLTGTEIAGEEIPGLVDEIPILAVLAASASSPTRIADAGELRVKETDRLRAIAEALETLGVPVEELPDGLVIGGGGFRRGGMVRSHGDHRIAMSLRVAALASPEPVEVDGADVCRVSDPRFDDNVRGLVAS